MIREDAEMPISRFCDVLGIPRRSYFRRLALLRSGESAVHGRTAALLTQLSAPIIAEYAARWPEYGHRRIHALMLSDGHVTSPATVLRAMRLMRGPRFAADDGASESEHWHNG